MIRATLRSSPEDFQVIEEPAYLPSGAGEHLYVTFRKRGLDTMQAVGILARKLGVSPRDAGTAGLKDRHAVTTQTASFPLPLARPLPDPAALASDDIEVLSVARHGNKLKTGHLRGNRFSIALRNIPAAERAALQQALDRLGREGVANRFGVQRFGRHGDNAQLARAWLSGKDRPPRDTRIRRLHYSALQSELFHLVLDRRIAAGTWSIALPGDLLVHPGGGRHLSCPDPAAFAQAITSGELSPSGPMYGAKMPWPQGEPEALERQVLAEAEVDPTWFETWKSLGEGARRALCLRPSGMHTKLHEDATSLQVEFMLPRGAYATTVLGAVCVLEDATRPGRASEPGGEESPEPTSGEETG